MILRMMKNTVHLVSITVIKVFEYQTLCTHVDMNRHFTSYNGIDSVSAPGDIVEEAEHLAAENKAGHCRRRGCHRCLLSLLGKQRANERGRPRQAAGASLPPTIGGGARDPSCCRSARPSLFSMTTTLLSPLAGRSPLAPMILRQ